MNQRLHGLKLRALVREHLAGTRHESDIESADPVDIGVGAAMVVADRAWMLVEDRHDRSLGIGLAWMQRCKASALHVLTDRSADAIARRAGHFALDVDVWEIRDRSLVRAVPSAFEAEREPAVEHLEFGSLILEAGADVVIEHGILSGEVRGLEVCRVVDDAESGRPRLEVGVGAHDREAFALMHGDTPTPDSLRRIVDVVQRHRRAGADPHPLNRLASERALRARILDEPDRIGARHLRAVSPATPRVNVKDSVPCAAIGETSDGENVLAVFSTGIDLDVVPTAADIRAWHGVLEARLAIVVPERDASPVTRRLAATLREPAEIVAVAPL